MLGGSSSRGFNDNPMRGYPLRLALTTRQLTDVVMTDEEILSVKGGRTVKDDESVSMDEETRREKTRKTCALRYLDGYPDAKVIDPIKENYPACTMPLSATSPMHVTPEILCNTQYAQEYVEHVALVRELLDQASLSTNPDLLKRSSNKLLQSLGGLLRGASDCELTLEPIPVWNLVKVVRNKPDAELVRQTTTLMGSDEDISINMPSAPMPMPEGQYWMNQDGTTAKAASLAVPPTLWNHSVQRLTQHFEQMSMRNADQSMDFGSLLDDPTAEAVQTQLSHDEISWEYYTDHLFPALELVPMVDRHHGTRLDLRAIGSQFNWTLNQEVVFSAALTGKPKKKLYFSQYCWKRRVIGTKYDNATAVSKPEWQHALSHGDLQSLQQPDCRSTDLLPSQQHRISECGRVSRSVLGLHLANRLSWKRATARMEDNQAQRLEGIH